MALSGSDFMTLTTSYELLKKKYDNFVAPSVSIVAEGENLRERRDIGINNLSVDLSCGYEASGCSFDVLGEFLPDKTSFDKTGSFPFLQIGAKIELSIGYIKMEPVFQGLIIEVEYRFEGDELPVIHVECVDAKCLLMKMRRLEIRTNKNIGDTVRQLLSESPVSTYLDGMEIEQGIGSSEKPLYTAAKDDYQFIVRNAKCQGCEFFVLQGKAHFRRPPASGAPVMALSPESGLLEARFSLSGATLVKRIAMTGLGSSDDKAVRGGATVSGKFSAGSTAARMLNDTVKAYNDQTLGSSQDANAFAKAMAEELRCQFGVFTATCIGIPELAPGRFVRISGVMPEANKRFYLTNVRHEIGEQGYITKIEARIKSL